MDNILLIDFHNALWRASIGFAPKKSAPPADPWSGSAIVEPNKISDQFVIVFNFFRNLRPIIEQFSPDKCFCVLEGHPQFRYDLFPEYKANRITKQASKKDTLDRFYASKDIVVNLLGYLPITLARAANYEADDLIATLCDNLKDEKLTVLSADNDYVQLLQRGYPNCQIYNPIKKVFMEAPDYPFIAGKCLLGDKSDNIPNLLGPKKALKTISSPELFAAFMEVEENKANFNINRQLIEFRSIPEEEIVFKEGKKDFVKLKDEFAKMEFQSIINDKSWAKYTSTFDCLKY